eukprot:TRINITY_DN423_c0_g1_i1.p3 TRINITY_DN423_c0_g1~~TRINITY_DN423_c0_g1_i1.p3  ORF type:complete len:113 (+),score=12.28 TRINITY_DN423_c0_g1_i1:155-493(+)
MFCCFVSSYPRLFDNLAGFFGIFTNTAGHDREYVVLFAAPFWKLLGCPWCGASRRVYWRVAAVQCSSDANGQCFSPLFSCRSLSCITAGGIITGQQVFGRGTLDMLVHFNTM